eukprot:364508-Chlamydomonas_euryale.AAC.19
MCVSVCSSALVSSKPREKTLRTVPICVWLRLDAAGSGGRCCGKSMQSACAAASPTPAVPQQAHACGLTLLSHSSCHRPISFSQRMRED